MAKIFERRLNSYVQNANPSKILWDDFEKLSEILREIGDVAFP